MPTSVNSLLDGRPALQNDRMLRSGYEDFRGMMMGIDGAGNAVPGTTGPNILITDRNWFEYEGVGTMDSAVIINAGTGLLLTANMTSDNVGLELHPGVAAQTRGRGRFVVGTDDPFYVSATFKLHDVSGTDVCLVGFRKVEANQTAADGQETYTDIATLNVNAGEIYSKTIVGDATTINTDSLSTWVDDGTHKLSVLVDKLGKAYYEVDNVPLVTVAYTFTAALALIPFFRIQNATDIADATLMTEFAWGFQGDSIAPRRYGQNTVGV